MRVLRKYITLFAPSGPPLKGRVRAGLEIVRRECPDLYDALEGVDELESMPASPFPWLFSADKSQSGAFEMLVRGNSSFLWAVRGGYGIFRWLEMVGWKALSHKSIPTVAGFSDITLLHAVLNNLGFETLHAPMLSTLEETDRASRAALWNCFLQGGLPSVKGDITLLGGGTVRGRLSGGNLCSLCHLVGTPWEPRLKGSILFLEETSEPLYRIDRMLTHLIVSGILTEVRGVALGDFGVDQGERELLNALFEDRFRRLGVPVAAGFPVGHGAVNMPLLLGGKYELQCSAPLLQPLDSVSTPFR